MAIAVAEAAKHAMLKNFIVIGGYECVGKMGRIREGDIRGRQ